MKRKTIPKTTRFEVFKRDSFCCQYCGREAPSVVLQVDHIQPVAKGGGNEITNLVTSCADCNSGKGARTLDDMTVVAKQKAQMDALQERREQIEMMMDWHRGLAQQDKALKADVDLFWEELTGVETTPYAQRKISEHMRRHGASNVMTAMRKVVPQFLETINGLATDESLDKCVNFIKSELRFMQEDEEDPDTRRIYFVRGILRKRIGAGKAYDNELLEAIKHLRDSGVSLDDIEETARKTDNIGQFRRYCNNA